MNLISNQLLGIVGWLSDGDGECDGDVDGSSVFESVLCHRGPDIE